MTQTYSCIDKGTSYQVELIFISQEKILITVLLFYQKHLNAISLPKILSRRKKHCNYMTGNCHWTDILCSKLPIQPNTLFGNQQPLQFLWERREGLVVFGLVAAELVDKTPSPSLNKGATTIPLFDCFACVLGPSLDLSTLDADSVQHILRPTSQSLPSIWNWCK